MRNPFDPNNPTSTAPITASITANAFSIKISWTDPQLDVFTGFKLYRKTHSDTTFTVIANPLLPSRRSFTDFDIQPGTGYDYYLTILSEDLESKASNIVSITPGPGLNWVVDRNAFQVVKLSYDTEHLFFRVDVDPYPQDMAVMIDQGIGLITFPAFGTVSTLNLVDGSFRGRFDDISHPYEVVADDHYFWITDSSGFLYRMDVQNESIELVDHLVQKPTSLAIDTSAHRIYLTDSKLKQVRIYNADGSLYTEIEQVNNRLLGGPESVTVSPEQNRLWFVDTRGNMDYIYTGTLPASNFFLADSLPNAGAIDISPFDGSAWVVALDRAQSFVMQLSIDGTRQRVISDLYNPADVRVNPYDESLLILDSGNFRLLHYNTDYELIGMYRRFAYPIRVIIE